MSRRTPEEELRDFARLQVRAGLLGPDDVLREVREAIEVELSGFTGQEAETLARAWILAAAKELAAEAETWPSVTDYDRLQAVFADCAAHDVRVLQGVEDHWSAKQELDRDGVRLRGILWFTPPDVWHAIDDGMLEVNLWHADTANAAPGDPLLDSVLGAFAQQGLAARFDEGRVEVGAHWQRRPSA